MVVKINGVDFKHLLDEMCEPQILIGKQSCGMDTSVLNELFRGMEERLVTIDLSEQELESMSFFELTSYMLGFKAGESHVRNQF